MSSFNSGQDRPAHTDARQSTRRPMRRWLWFAILGFLLFDGVTTIHYLLFAPSNIDGVKIIGDIGNTLGWLLAVAFCISRLPRSWWKKETRAAITSALQTAQLRMPFWIGLAFCVNVIERGAYMFYDMAYTLPALDWPGIFLLLRYPFLLLAVLALYTYSLSFVARLRLALDGFLILTTLITFSWYFLLGPIMLDAHQDPIEKIRAIVYPLCDLVLCFYLFQLSFRNREPAFRLVKRLLIPGALLVVLSDLPNISQLLQTNPVLPMLQNLMLCTGYILIALAIQALYMIKAEQYIPAEETQDERRSSIPTFSLFLWQSLLPSACVPVVLLFMLIIWFAGGTGPLALGVYLSGVALIIQLVLRQILVVYETFIANQSLQQVQKELSEKNLALTQANHHSEEQAQELALAYEQQRQANKQKDQFMLNVNHELRTPLTELHGYLELLHYAQEAIDAKTHERYLSHALHGSYELQRMVDTILEALRSEYARESAHNEEVTVSSVVQEVIEFIDPGKREAYQIKLAVPMELTVQADRQYLRQILSNLLSNALKYTPPHTTIVIGAQAVPASIPSTDAPSQVYIWVQDYGPGIPPVTRDLLFSKFFRLPQHQTSSIRGSGLGLYICKQLVEAMDGRIWVESSGVPGEGSRFCISLPGKETECENAQV